MRPRITYGDQTWSTYCDINGDERDVTVYFDASPFEPDVNAGGGCEITGVFAKKEDVMGLMTDAEIETLSERAEEWFNDMSDPDNQDSY